MVFPRRSPISLEWQTGKHGPITRARRFANDNTKDLSYQPSSEESDSDMEVKQPDSKQAGSCWRQS